MSSKSAAGMTIIEVLIVVTVLIITLISLARVFAAGNALIADSRLRLIALSLANEQMEKLRNLPYDQVAVLGGVPAGNIPAVENREISGRRFQIKTDVRYIDDDLDGTLSGSPTDTVPADYKRVEVTVSWGEGDNAKVTLVSRFVPPGMETAAGGGTLVVNVLDASGAAVAGASVNLTTSSVSPAVDLTVFTDEDGRVVIPGAPAASDYAAVVSKNAHETVRTYPPYPQTSFRPVDEDIVVTENALTTRTLIAGKLSDMTLSSRDPFGEVLGNLQIRLRGGRLLGTLPDNTPVYNFDQNRTFSSGGEISLENLSPGNYEVTLLSAGYRLLDAGDSSTPAPETIALSEGAQASFTVTAVDENLPSLWVKVTDDGTGANISGATVRVQNTALSYDAQRDTSAYGRAYFPLSAAEGLVNGAAYTVSVSASGYRPDTQTITVNKLTEVNVSLVKN